MLLYVVTVFRSTRRSDKRLFEIKRKTMDIRRATNLFFRYTLSCYYMVWYVAGCCVHPAIRKILGPIWSHLKISMTWPCLSITINNF